MKTMSKARVLLTGANGFLGRQLAQLLAEEAYTLVNFGGDLTNARQARIVVENHAPLDYVFHLAGFNGGIEFNRKFPADIFYRNTVMGLNLLEACAGKKVGKVISVVASCAYPCRKDSEFYNCRDREVLEEYSFLDGEPHVSVACHGYAKRNLQLASQFYRQQHALHAVCVCPTTLYGPGDSFDPERTKVVGGMVHRFVEARRQNLDRVEVWGTGRPLRELLYVKDCAELLVQAAQKYNDSTMPLNLGNGQEVSIAFLARLVADAAGYRGTIQFDHSKPDGQMRKRLDLKQMQQVLGELPEFTPLHQGIRETVRWYEENYP